MKPDKFKKVAEETIEQCYDLLAIKEKDYSDGKDRLVQFKTASALSGKSQLECCAGMMVKHTTKLYTMLNDTHNGIETTRERWEEVIHDHINYLLLIKAVLVEEKLI